MEENITESLVQDNSANVVPNLRDLLSEDLREIKALKNYDTVDAMAKSLLSAQELVGKRVRDLTPEELVGLDKKFGMPDDISGYDFESDDSFKERALKAGLNSIQAKKLLDIEIGAHSVKEEELKVKAAERVKEVGKELEDAFGRQFEARIEIAKRAALELGGEDLLKAVFDESNVGDPKIIKALSEAGKRLFDHESVGTNQILKLGLSPQDAKNEIEMKKNDPEFMVAYLDVMHPGHKKAVEEMATLHRKKLGLE
jgi:hypothetical protein